MDAQIKEPHTLTGFLSFLVCRCNHHPMWDDNHHKKQQLQLKSWREPGDVHCQSGCWVPIYRLGDHMEPMSQRSTWHGMCLLSSPAQGTTQPWSRPGGSLLGSWEPGEMAYVCARVPGPGHAKPQLQFLERSMHVLACFVHHRNRMHFQLWFQNWWAVYVLNNVFTFQRRWPVLRTLALRKFLIELNAKLPALYSHPVGLIESIVNGKVQHLYGRSLQPNSTWAKCRRG